MMKKCGELGHCGNDTDEDCDTLDLACAANDVAGGAIDVTAGGTFTADALAARDDVAPNGCGGDGGRDLFYRVTLGAPQVYYFDTFGSSFDSTIRVDRKPCATLLVVVERHDLLDGHRAVVLVVTHQ